MHLCTEQLHAVDIERLTLGVLLTHEDFALHAEQCSGGSGCHAVLTCTGLRDDTGLAHTLGKQGLTEYIVDLV